MAPGRNETYHSEAVQEIMGSIPSGITRWGATAIAGVFALIVLGCCIIKYPETLSAPVTITGANPPSQLVSRYTGILDTVAARSGEKVRQGELIALLKTPARYADVVRLRTFIDSCRQVSDLSEVASAPLLSENLSLGGLQDKWTELRSLADEYALYRRLDENGRKKELIREQLSGSREYNDRLRRQRNLTQEDVLLQKKALDRDSALLSDKLIAPAAYEQSRQSYLSKLSSLAAFDASLKSAELSTLSLEQSLSELDLQTQQEENQYRVRWSQCIAGLAALAASWMDTYAIVAPFDGTLSLQDFWSAGQHVTAGDIIANVIPDAGTAAVGRLKVPSSGFGKVSEGQTVNIRLNGFPYMEFGILKGRIERVSQVPEKLSDGSLAYTVEVSLPDGLVTTYSRELPFIPDMDGTAEIITRDRRLIERFTDPIISLFRNT